MATVDADGMVTNQTAAGPFGEKLPNKPDAWNTLNGGTYGYVGAAKKLNETALSIRPVQMGARVYIPGLGRFLQVDPIQGGTPNNYVYPSDPVNDFDLDGNFGWKSFANIASWASMIPGPIGMVASGVAAASYAAAGDYKSAAVAVAGIALAAVGAGAAIKAVQAVKAAGVGAKVAKAGVKLKDVAHIGAFSKTTGINSKLFGKGGEVAGKALRKGALNNNDIMRVGWGWHGTAKNGNLVFRVAFGPAKWKSHPHINVRSYKPVSKKWYR